MLLKQATLSTFSRPLLSEPPQIEFTLGTFGYIPLGVAALFCRLSCMSCTYAARFVTSFWSQVTASGVH